MTGLDANVLIRLFAQDDPAQTAIARRVLERFTEGDPGFISLVAMTETVWVLNRVYGMSMIQVVEAVEGLLQTESVVVQNAEEVFIAVHAVQEGLGGFADVLIAALGHWAGCNTTLTFDVKASRLEGFTRL
jgi:predicted nucleic-acid-binding protein